MSGNFKRSLLLVAATAIVTGLLMGPVGAHVNRRFGHLWSTHIRPKVAWQIVSAQVSIPGNGSEFASVNCPAGKRPTGGGVDALQPNNGHNSAQRVIESYPTASGWEAFIANDTAGDPRTATVYAICTAL